TCGCTAGVAVECLLVGSGKCSTHHAARRWNEAKEFSLFAEHLEARVRGDIQPALRIDRAAVAIASGLEFCKFASVFGRAVRLDVVGHHDGAIRYIKDGFRTI